MAWERAEERELAEALGLRVAAEPLERLELLELEEPAALLALRPAERRKEARALARQAQQILVAQPELEEQTELAE